MLNLYIPSNTFINEHLVLSENTHWLRVDGYFHPCLAVRWSGMFYLVSQQVQAMVSFGGRGRALRATYLSFKQSVYFLAHYKF